METEVQKIRDWLGSGSINIFGRPFAGKDTQGALLAELFNGVPLSSGDILRKSVIPEHVKTVMHAGLLIPSADFVSIVLPYLSHHDFKHRPLILSSVGRWKGEEDGVIQATNESGHPIKAVVYLALDEDLVHERWHHRDTSIRGDRHDDNIEVLDQRLKEYREKTLPVLESYRQKGLLIEIDGNQSVEEVNRQILGELASRASASP